MPYPTVAAAGDAETAHRTPRGGKVYFRAVQRTERKGPEE
jgi:hypothetical protein